MNNHPQEIVNRVLLTLLLCLPLSLWAETYSYDSAGRLTSVTYPDASSLTYSYDANGNILSRTAATGPVDTTPPVLTLNGNDPLTVRQGDVFTDPGATAIDDVDGNVNATTPDTVNTNVLGSTLLTYTATDNAGNSAQLTRAVQVIASELATLPNSDTVQVDLPLGTDFISAPVTAGSVTNGPAGILTDLGTVSFSLTVLNPGDSATITLTFSAPLPNNLILYKVDNANNYTPIPTNLWTQTSPNTLEITLTDGGSFDLDGIANGTIVDPIAFATIAPVASNNRSRKSSGSFDSVLLSVLVLSLLGLYRRRRD